MPHTRRLGSFVAPLVCAAIFFGPRVTALRAGDAPAPGARAAAAIITAVAVPGADAIKIDGELTEQSWNAATPITDFRQRDPSEGAASTHATDVRVLYDHTSLYVAVRAMDPEPDKIAGLLTRRDDNSPSDWVSILIDSYHDRRTAFEFGVNPKGVMFDAYWYNDNNNDRGWDAVWSSAVTRDAEGWRAEFKIPFSQLRFNASSPDGFGFAVIRRIAHANEVATWPLLARSASGMVSSFGDLRGISLGGTQQKRLELSPYVVAQATTSPIDHGNPLVSSPDGSASVGLDMKYRLGAGLTLTGTINPDFGQVEADPAVVNLGAFETYFDERRPFFVEGSGNFSFRNLFYSRRIGRQPQRFMAAPDDGFATQPSNSTVVGAAKLTGRIGNFSIGVLNAVTSAEYADVASGPSLTRTTSPVEPTTNYSVARASREFTNNSRLSFMMTSTTRRLTDDLRFLPSSAFVGAIDGDWRLGGGRYSLVGYWSASSVQGAAESIDRLQRNNVHSFQRPDADYLTYDPLRTSLVGNSGSVSARKISGERTRFEFNGGYTSPGYDINDLGFQSRADEIWQNSWVQIRSDKLGKRVRNKNINFNQWSGWNFGGDRRQLGINVNSHWTFTNNWSIGSGFNVNYTSFADRLTRGGPGGLVPGNINQWGYLDTDNRKLVTLNFFGSWFNDRAGSRNWSTSYGFTVRPNAALTFSPRLELEHNLSQSQWVGKVDDESGTHYVFGRIDQTTVGFGVRANYTIRPTLTLQIYARPFVSAGAYSGFKQLANGQARDDADRYTPFAYADHPDFRVQSFRTTNVLRWEYRPGSALFVVWQQGRDDVADNGDFRFGRDLGRTFSAPATNVFLVKISRWLNF